MRMPFTSRKPYTRDLEFIFSSKYNLTSFFFCWTRRLWCSFPAYWHFSWITASFWTPPWIPHSHKQCVVIWRLNFPDPKPFHLYVSSSVNAFADTPNVAGCFYYRDWLGNIWWSSFWSGEFKSLVRSSASFSYSFSVYWFETMLLFSFFIFAAEHYRPMPWFYWLWFVCLLQTQREVTMVGG